MASIVAAAVVAASTTTFAAGTLAAGALIVGAALVDLGISAGLSSRAKKKAKDKAREAALQRDVTFRSTVGPRAIVLGKARTSGPIIYTNNSTTAGTSDNDSLWAFVPMTGHEVHDIESLWVDDEEITSGQINWGTAAISGGRFSSHLKVSRGLGTSTQAVDSRLAAAFSSDWTTDHRARGCSYVVFEFISSTTALNAGTYESGPPQQLQAVVKGAKVYDPRLDSTFTGAWGTGSGAHRTGTPSTWAWAANPALCWAWYLMDTTVGRSVPASAIDWNSVAVAADICDDAVDIPGPSTEARYTCNGVLFADADPAENLAAILGCMLGRMQHIGGKYYVQAGAYVTPTETIGANEIVEAISVQTVSPKTDRINQLRYRYVSADLRYTETEAFHVTNTTTRTDRDDGEVLPDDVANPLVNSETQAQRLAFLMLQQNTQMHRLTATVNWRGMRITPGDGVSVTFSPIGYSSKAMLCEGLSYDRERGFTVLLREDSSAAWADPEIADYQVRPDPNTITIGDLTIPAPSGLTATGVSEGILLDWDDQTVNAQDTFLVYASATSAWADASLIGQTQATTFLHQLPADTVRYYWVRGQLGQYTSARDPDSDTSSVTATAQRVGYADAEYGAGAFVESFSAETVANGVTSLRNWEFVKETSPAATLDVITDANSPLHQNTLNAHGEVYLRSKRSFAYDRSKTYRLTAILRRSGAITGTCYVGLLAVEGDGTIVDTGGTTTTYTGHWSSNGLVSADMTTGYVEYAGHIAGVAATGTNASTSIPGALVSAPIEMIDTTTRVRIVVLLNDGASANTELTQLAGIIFQPVEDVVASISDDRLSPVRSDLDNARVVVPSAPQGQAWRSDSAGAGPSGDPSVVLTARFSRNGSEIATYPVTFALTSSSGVINRTLGTATGETTSASTTGNGTSMVSVTITHTASNQKAYLSASWADESSIASGGGGITK